MVLIHCLSQPVSVLDHNSWQFALVLCVQRLAFVSVPGFFFLSGLKLTLFADRHRSLIKYWLGRVRTILLPYILAVAIYYLYFWTHHYFPFSLADFGGYLVRGDLSSHFYFVVALMQFVVLTPLFLWLARRFDPAILLPFALGLTWLSSLYLQPILSTILPGVEFPYGDRVFLSYLVYYLAGCCAGQAYPKFLALLEHNAPLIAVLAVVFAAWDAGASWLGFSGRQSIPYLELVHTLYILSAILLLFVLASRGPHSPLPLLGGGGPGQLPHLPVPLSGHCHLQRPGDPPEPVVGGDRTGAAAAGSLPGDHWRRPAVAVDDKNAASASDLRRPTCRHPVVKGYILFVLFYLYITPLSSG
mgnify:CR=1 FL=1